MGKASKWIMNFLTGKRDDRRKKTGPLPVSSETSPLITVDTPKVQRRWSFTRSTGNRKAVTIQRRSSMSFDSIVIPTQAYHAQHKRHGMRRVLSAHDAAMKIQAIYRSYLARRALWALRALVKLQALARGYLVRKQMNNVVRSVHAVMKIQVRARIHRVQMAEEPPVMAGRRSYRESPVSDRHLRKETREHTAEANGFRPSGGLRSRSYRAESVLADRVECGCKICCPDRFSVSQKDYKPHVLASPSALSFTDSTSTTYDGQLEEYSLKMEQRNSRRYYSCPENKYPFICLPAQCPDYISSGSHFTPNYMTNTESSKAKARSHSEPRQRPNTKHSRRTTSMDEKNDQENQFPWLTKLRRAHKFTTDRVPESYISVATSISNSTKSLIPFEPPMNLN